MGFPVPGLGSQEGMLHPLQVFAGAGLTEYGCLHGAQQLEACPAPGLALPVRLRTQSPSLPQPPEVRAHLGCGGFVPSSLHFPGPRS